MNDLVKTVLEPELVAEMARIGVERSPSEACGVLLPFAYGGRQVYELPNRAELHHDTFEVWSTDIVMTLQDWIDRYPQATWDEITIWHTHPQGQNGPSRQDLHSRSEHCGNLVIALTEHGPLATLF